jgi:hypothetical protein
MSQRDAVLNRMTAAILSVAMREYVKAGEFKTPDTYTRQMRRSVSALFGGSIDEFQFIDEMMAMINNQLNMAWKVGAYDVGVMETDFVFEDFQHLDSIINNEYQFILRFAQDIVDTRLAGGKIDALLARVDLWANRYNEVVAEAHVWFGKKTRLQWRKGNTEKHCATCLALDGIIAFAEEWNASGVRPQAPPNPHLECEGWKCDCYLNPTDQRRTPRAFERIMNVVMSKGGRL